MEISCRPRKSHDANKLERRKLQFSSRLKRGVYCVNFTAKFPLIRLNLQRLKSNVLLFVWSPSQGCRSVCIFFFFFHFLPSRCKTQLSPVVKMCHFMSILVTTHWPVRCQFTLNTVHMPRSQIHWRCDTNSPTSAACLGRDWRKKTCGAAVFVFPWAASASLCRLL